MKNVLYVGPDVDDKNFHIGAIDSETGEVFETSCKSTTGSLIKQLEKFKAQGKSLKLCYEATYLGFSLHRALKKEGFDCQVIAPSMIPEIASSRVKTDTEYSSGGKERKFGITKMGNKRIRTAAVEACQRTGGGYVLSRRLLSHRVEQDPKIIEIADRCIKRLRTKSTRMNIAGKPMNKIKVACAREFMGFVWEALIKIA